MKKPKTPPKAAAVGLDWRLAPRPIAIGLLAWAIVVLVLYLRRFPAGFSNIGPVLDILGSMGFVHPYALKMGAGLLTAAGLLWVSYGAGATITSRWDADRLLTPAEHVVFGTGLGLAILSFAAFGLGAAHLWRRDVFATLAVVAGVFFAWRRPSLPKPEREPTRLWAGPARVLWGTLLAIYAVFHLIGSLSPETFYDALYYHIAVPNLYRLHGGLFSLPTLLFSNFVLTVQFLYGFALTVGNVVSAKCLHFACGLLLGLSYLAFGRRYGRPGSGWIAAALFLTLPVGALNGITTGIDVAWSFFSFLSAYALALALDRPSPRWLAFAGLFTGIAASCKYPGFPFIPLAAVVLVWRRRRNDHVTYAALAREAAWFALPAVAVIVPTLVKNALFHGNPLYPFGGTHFGHPLVTPANWHVFVSDANSRDLKAEFSSVGSAMRFLLHPWFITFDGGGDVVGPVLLGLLPLVFFLKTPGAGLQTARRYGGFIWLVWLATCTTPRYGLPAMAVIAPLLASALVALSEARGWRPWLFLVVALGTFSNVMLFGVVALGQQGWRVVGGQITESAFLGTMHASYPTPPYEGFAWMNENLPSDAKILVVGEARTYYTERMVVPSSVPDPQPIVSYANEAPDAAALAARLRAEGITHLYLNFGEAYRTRGYRLFKWTPEGWKVFSDFWDRYVRPVWKAENFAKNDYKALYVFEVMSDADAARSHPAPYNPFQHLREPF